MYTIYIDIPDDFDYDFTKSVSRQLNANAKFICNNLGKISEGDTYSVTFNNEQEAIVWLLKNSFKQVYKVKVEEYLLKKK